MRYRVAFPAGFKPLVERLIARDHPGGGKVDRDTGDDASVVFDAQAFIKKPAYVQGLSIVLGETKASTMEEAYRSIAGGLGQPRGGEALGVAIVHPAYSRHNARAGRPGSFVVRSFDQGKPSPSPRDARLALERQMQRLTGLVPDSERPDAELQLQLRSDGRAYLLLVSLDQAPGERSKGALPASTARLLCELSEPGAEDVFLDPFMGSGSIPLERARMGPYGMIFAGDMDEGLVGDFKERLKQQEWNRKRRNIFPKTLDARDLSRFDPSLFTRIVTDPPWGVYGDLGRDDILGLYRDFLGQAERVLGDQGKLVLLTGRDTPLEEAIRGNAASGAGRGWEKQVEYPVLISGRKARVLRLAKKISG
jgi:hypothetical protein